MPELAIRFTVRNQNGQRAATWKCWSLPGKEDVYLACRELGGALKTSMHESGDWHVAYFEGFYQRAVRDEDRTERGCFLDKWPRPQPIAPGVTLAFRIKTSWASVTTKAEELPSIVSIPAPAEGKAIECDVCLLAKEVSPEGWPGRDSMNTKLVGSYTLPAGGRVCVVWWEIDMPKIAPAQGTPKFYQGKSMEDLKAAEALRMLGFADEPDGSRAIYDCVLKNEKRDAGSA